MKISLLFSTPSTFSVLIAVLRSVLIVSSVEGFISSPRLCNRHLSISVDRKSPSSASRILPPLYTSSVGASSDNTSFLIEQRLLTLYEILQVPQNATRQELRKQYLTQAKSLHPDSSSSIAKRIIDVAGQEIEIEFTQVVFAWKILSDPIERKRYDRKLQADAITGGVGRAAEQFGKRTAPYMKQVFENVAIPLIRRTSATTQAIINAASEDIANQQKQQQQHNTRDVDLRKTALSAFEASQKANLEIDRYELELKLKELDKKYQDDTAHLAKLESQIEETTQQRLRVALRVPKENMSAQDALSVWESMNLTDTRSLFQPTPVQFKIEQLEVAESDYNMKKEERDRFEAEYERCKRAVDEANRKAKKAVEVCLFFKKWINPLCVV